MKKELTRICAMSPDGNSYGWPSLEELAETEPMVFFNTGTEIIEIGNFKSVAQKFFGLKYLLKTSIGQSVSLYHYRDDSDGKLWLGLPKGYYFGEEAFK